jgi:hypothetical protein
MHKIDKAMKTIREMLAVFQEGVIEEMSLIEKDLNIKVECKYLAEQIHPEYSVFYGVFKQVKDVFFVPWEDDLMEIREIKEIKRLRPDILSVDDENEYIKIYSNCKESYSGGNLYVAAKTIKIFDEDLRELKLEDLMEIADKYWYSNDRAEG